jgi:hypothetical protein
MATGTGLGEDELAAVGVPELDRPGLGDARLRRVELRKRECTPGEGEEQAAREHDQADQAV